MLLLAILCLSGAQPAGASVTDTIGSGTDLFSPHVDVVALPSFVIADKGIRHDFEPLYDSGFPLVLGGEPTPARTCRCLLASGPQGMTLTAEGVLEWIPEADEIGASEEFVVRVGVIEDEVEIFSAAKTFSLNVLATIPQLFDRPMVVTYEQDPIGWSNMTFSVYDPTNQDRSLFRWSLIGPPPGVYIDDSGGLHWPDDRGFARAEPYNFRIRIDYETASGSVSDETSYSRCVLPQAATNQYSELRSLQVLSQSSGMLGFSMAGGDGWLAAGEPFPSFAVADSENSGRVRFWKADASGGYAEALTIQPEAASHEAFGASLALSTQDASHPTRLAVGAPEASQIGEADSILSNVGSVYVYACDEDGSWSQEVRLDPPLSQQSLFFGGWVSIQGDTLIASMEGMDIAGVNAGALAIFRYEETEWVYSQMLKVPDPTSSDYFSYPAGISDGWIAAAANEDDDQGDNAGAVHLFQQQDGQFVHRQILYAPAPESGALFGERLLIKGEWLFVSSFREQSNLGAVHVYRLSESVWNFHQTLDAPFATAGSAFGVGLSCFGDVLAVSAPGYLFGSSDIDGSLYPWTGVTLYRLDDDLWSWSRQVTECPDRSSGNKTWGFSLAQLSPELTVASIPDHQAYANGEYRPLAGRLFLHRWPELLEDPFAETLAGLPEIQGQPATASGDNNQNGVPNIIDWIVGQDPGEGPDYWTSLVPQSKKPFIKLDAGASGMRFMVPKLVPSLSHQVVIEVSGNMIDWEPVTEAQWGALEEVYFPTADGSRTLTYFHPVLIPMEELDPSASRFVRLSVP